MDQELDLRGVRCPLSWARARVRLDEMKPGERLTLLIDEERGIRDIPRAAEAAGFAAGEPRRESAWWTLTLEV